MPGHCEFSSFADCILFLFPEGRCVFFRCKRNQWKKLLENNVGRGGWDRKILILGRLELRIQDETALSVRERCSFDRWSSQPGIHWVYIYIYTYVYIYNHMYILYYNTYTVHLFNIPWIHEHSHCKPGSTIGVPLHFLAYLLICTEELIRL